MAKCEQRRGGGPSYYSPHGSPRRPTGESAHRYVAAVRDTRERPPMLIVVHPLTASGDDKVVQMLRLAHKSLPIHNVEKARKVLRNVEDNFDVLGGLPRDGVLGHDEVEGPSDLAGIVPRDAVDGQTVGVGVVIGIGIAVRWGGGVPRPAHGTDVILHEVIAVAWVGRNEGPGVRRDAVRCHGSRHRPDAARVAQLLAVGEAVPVAVGSAQLRRPLEPGVPEVGPEGVQRLRHGSRDPAAAGGMADASADALDAALRAGGAGNLEAVR